MLVRCGEAHPNGHRDAPPLPGGERVGVRGLRPLRLSARPRSSSYLVGPTTSTLPAAVRALYSGRYMSSIVAAGCANTPGETALTE